MAVRTHDAAPASTSPVGDLGPPAPRAYTYRRVYASVAVLALSLTALGALWFTNSGMALTPDSAVYASAAENLIDGRGLTTPFVSEGSRYRPAEQVSFGQRVPLVYYPPLYAVAIALPRSVGINPTDSVRIVNSVSLAALVGVIALALWWLARPNVVALVAFSALAVLGPTAEPNPFLGNLHALGLASYLLSEALFIPLCLGALLAGARAATAPGRRALAVAIGLVVLATLTRYIGVSTGVAAGIAIFVGAGDPRRRLRRAAAVAAAGPLALVGWNLLNSLAWGAGSARGLGWHPDAINTRLMWDTMAGWFHLRFDVPYAARVTTVILLVLIPVLVVLVPGAYRRICGEPLRPQELRGAILVTLASFILVYPLALIASLVFFDASTLPDQRLLIPVQLCCYLLIATLIARAVSTRIRAHADQLIWAALGIVALALVATSFGDLSTDAAFIHRAARGQRHGAAHNPLRDVPTRAVVFTNNTSGLWQGTGHGSYLIPSKFVETIQRRNRHYVADLQWIARYLSRHPGIVWIVLPVAPHPYDVHAEDYEKHTPLRVVARCSSGQPIIAIPDTALARQATKWCPAP